jgi:hypothetical protein
MATPNPGWVVEELALERFLDSFSPDPKLHPDSHRALRLAAHARTSSRLLSDAYRATSIALFGQTISNQSVIQAARRMYGNGLKDLQRAIYHPEDSRSMSVLLTTALLFIWEVSIFMDDTVVPHNLTLSRPFNIQQGGPSWPIGGAF